MAIELLGDKQYTCPTLTLAKGKEKVKVEEKELYLFYISKADQIFDFLQKTNRLSFQKGISNLQRIKFKI